jgi:hypothetical protein
MKYLFKITRKNELKTYARMMNIKEDVYLNMENKI